MNLDVSLRKGIVYIPTMGKMDRGFYRGVEPVDVVAVSNTEALRKAIEAAIVRGNPPVPIPHRRDWPPPVVLKYAGVRSWSAFERGTMLWSIEKRDGSFQIARQKKQANGVWKDDPTCIVSFPSNAAIDEVIARVVIILQEAAGGMNATVRLLGGFARSSRPPCFT
jgi:hypothetical protein